MTLILGIESSCDETAAAVVRDGRVVLSNIVASQHDLHGQYGGVVPEIASRAHLERISPVITEALDQANTDISRLDAVAVGNRPGLIGSLLVGVSAAKAIAWSANKPLIGVDHVRAHLHAAMLVPADQAQQAPAPTFPALGLVVSGGHTNLYLLHDQGRADLIGKTIDDAAGEAYDKAAVLLGLGFPGGPALDRFSKHGDPKSHKLPRSTLAPDSLDFSFSGLKTALLYSVRGKPTRRGKRAVFTRSHEDLTEQQRADLAAAFQASVVEVITLKLERAYKKLAAEAQAPRSLIIGGGVSANSLLRERAIKLGKRLDLPVHIPALSYCVDNAAMIAGYAHTRYTASERDGLDLAAVAVGTDMAAGR